MKHTHDIIIIGAGSAGLSAAQFAARFGVKTLLIERARIGGDCTWTGCIPSKALIHAAKTVHMARKAACFGISPSVTRADMSQVRDYIRQTIHTIYSHENQEQLGEQGIETALGEARFLDAHTIRVSEQTFSAKYFVIATGARPLIPAVQGLSDVPYFTYEHFFGNDRLPDHLLIIGAGPVGTEIAQAYRRLGAQVTLVGPGLLPRDDEEATAVLKTVFAREGITFIQQNVTNAHHESGMMTLRMANGEAVKGDMLLVAAGRKPNVSGLDLEKAGIRFSEKGIIVDSKLRTSAPHIFAAGDCIGGMQFTHLAGLQGFQAVRNAVLPLPADGMPRIIPWTAFTDPELAQVGLTEAQARKQHGDAVHITRLPMSRTDRAITDGDTDGFIKLVHKRDGTLLGATVLAARAGEIITEFALALEHGLKPGDLATTVHPYPTYSTASQLALSQVTTEALLTGFTGAALRKISALTR